jgi:hypothetical protein
MDRPAATNPAAHATLGLDTSGRVLLVCAEGSTNPGL